jgi:hypothetical protein
MSPDRFPLLLRLLSGNLRTVSQWQIIGKRNLKISGCTANLHVEILADQRIPRPTLMEVNKYKSMINGVEGLYIQTLKSVNMDIPGMPDLQSGGHPYLCQ